jgi:hypothetical protein
MLCVVHDRSRDPGSDDREAARQQGDAAVAPLTRGRQFVGYVERLRAWGELERVASQLDAATRLLVDLPPHATEWIPLQRNVSLFAAVEETLGPGRARALAYETVRSTLGPNLGPVIEVALSAFGASPRTLFTHANVLLRFGFRGQQVLFEEDGPTSGLLEIRVFSLRPPPAFYEAWSGIVLYAFDLCGARGDVSIGRLEERGNDGVGVLRVTWI